MLQLILSCILLSLMIVCVIIVSSRIIACLSKFNENLDRIKDLVKACTQYIEKNQSAIQLPINRNTEPFGQKELKKDTNIVPEIDPEMFKSKLANPPRAKGFGGSGVVEKNDR